MFVSDLLRFHLVEASRTKKLVGRHGLQSDAGQVKIFPLAARGVALEIGRVARVSAHAVFLQGFLGSFLPGGLFPNGGLLLLVSLLAIAEDGLLPASAHGLLSTFKILETRIFICNKTIHLNTRQFRRQYFLSLSQ